MRKANVHKVKAPTIFKLLKEQSVEYLKQLLIDNRLHYLELKDKTKGVYTTSTHLCAYKLIDTNVAFKKITNVIKLWHNYVVNVK